MDYSKKIYYTEKDWHTGLNVIREATLAEFLREFCSDETTTPGGVAPRLHVRRSGHRWQVWTWGAAGNNPRLLDEHSTEAEAEQDILSAWYIAWLEGRHNTPATWDSVGDLLRDAQEDGVLIVTQEQHQAAMNPPKHA